MAENATVADLQPPLRSIVWNYFEKTASESSAKGQAYIEALQQYIKHDQGNMRIVFDFKLFSMCCIENALRF